MADNTSIPIIVQGNSFSLAIPLQIYVIDDNEMVLEDYSPDPTDEVTIQLKGSRRNYTYTPTIEGNIANIDLGGYELADNYAVVVTIVKQDGKRLRSFRTDQFFIVESSDDLTQDDIIAGLEENVIYLNAQAFIAGADGRGIEGIQKTGTSGLVDTYTIYYTDNTTTTFQVTNGEQGAQGVGITSIEKTGTSGLVDTYTITLSNGSTSTFEVTNGKDGVDLGLATIADNLTTDDPLQVLSARQGVVLADMIDNLGTLDSEDIGLAEVTLNIKFSLTQNLTDLTSSVDATTVNYGAALTVTLTAASGYTVGTCSVTMGGTDITSTAYSNNVITIAEVTGDVVITAVAAEAGNIPVQFADSAVETIMLANTTHANPNYITEEEALLVTQIGSNYSQGSWFKGNTNITSFDELGQFGVTSLYEGAFNGCTALESIDISKIGALTTRDSFGGTFQNCSSLLKIKTSNTLTTIPVNCFRGCSSLKLVDLGESVVTLKATILQNAPVTTIIMRSTTPPNYEYTWNKTGCKLYVPDEAFSAYQATSWGTNYPAVADSSGKQMLPLSQYVEE